MGAIADAALYLLGKVAAAIVIVASCGLAGGLVLPRREGDSASERIAVGMTLGLALLAQAFLLLGLAKVLTAAAVSIVLILVAAASGRLRARDYREDLAQLRVETSRPSLLALLIAAALFVLFLASALRLPLSFDETMYHLPYARGFAETGTLPWLEDVRFPIFPQAGEALFAACLLLADDVTAHLVSLLATPLAAALAALWARREAGPPAGMLAAAVVLGDPVVACYSGLALVDPILMLFVTGCLYALSRAAETGETRWLAVSGALAGSAASVKYHGLFFVAAAGASLFLGRRSRWRRAGLFACFALAAALPTYGHLVRETGNPVFPFASSIFGPSEWSEWDSLLPRPQAGQGVVSVVSGFGSRAIRLAGDLLLMRGLIWYPPLSPLLLAAALVGGVFALRKRGAMALFPLLATVYIALILLLPTDPRFLLPLVPGAAALGGAAVASLIRRLRPSRGRILATLLTLAALVPGATYLIRIQPMRGPLPLTAAVRERTFETLLPPYRAIRALNQRYGSRYVVYGFGGENMAYFARGRLRGDFCGPWAYWRILLRVNAPGGIQAALSEMSATHLLVVRGSLHEAQIPREGLIEEYRDDGAVVYRLERPGGASTPGTPP